MTHQLLDSTDIMSPNYTKFTREIAADTDQKVYVGFHAISPAEKGELRVDGSFKTPSLTLGGDTLGNNLTKVEVLRNGKLLQTYEAPDTASVLTFTDDQPVNGFNNYWPTISGSEPTMRLLPAELEAERPNWIAFCSPALVS